jgi:hypothetical protein
MSYLRAKYSTFYATIARDKLEIAFKVENMNLVN